RLSNPLMKIDARVYIHISFCRSRCSYRDLATGGYESELAARYVQAVATEITAGREVEQPSDVDTIYFGGGTPSLLTPAQIEQILKAVRDRFKVLDGAEVTMEMNPASIVAAPTRITEISQRKDNSHEPELSSDKLQQFRRLGINRASFGAQTFDDRELKQLGRTHTSADIPATFQGLREAGFENINFDLIAGLPGQTLAGWKGNLDLALNLRPEHLSL